MERKDIKSKETHGMLQDIEKERREAMDIIKRVNQRAKELK